MKEIFIREFNDSHKMLQISNKQYLKLKLFGTVFLENRKEQGWTENMPVYILKCATHGYIITHKRGYGNLICRACVEEHLS